MLEPKPDHESLDPLDDADLDRMLDGVFAASGAADDLQLDPSCESALTRIDGLGPDTPVPTLRDSHRSDLEPVIRPQGTDGPRTAGRYVLHGLLGRGGVGDVHYGRDTDLGREVALKFLRQEFQGNRSVLQRFVEEAQIGSQLQHPGIVPVYELGASDGRPFFTMKLVKGVTLAKQLSERSSPATDRRTFLTIFESVCQTMAYAHERGVVHRDLKPANIMIGAFGEVQVVDWGMSKVLQFGGAADERRAVARQKERSPLDALRLRDTRDASITGTVLGTPAYMAPEQARGQVEDMDERSDVFALGAILCEILTGLPPYVGEPQEQLEMAAAAQLDEARDRLAACGADDALIQLGLSCLVPAPSSRPSAKAVAQAVQSYLAAVEARLQDARVEAAEAKVQTRSLQRLQRLGMAATVLIASALAVVYIFWQEAEEQRGVAETSLSNFNLLATLVELENAERARESIDATGPDRVRALQAWLDRHARPLQAKLPELRAALRTMSSKALPDQSGASAEQETHPKAVRLRELRQKLESRRLETGRHPDLRRRVGPAELIRGSIDSRDLLKTFDDWIMPGRTIFGREAEGLALARKALELAKGEGGKKRDIAMAHYWLAWALTRNGLHEEARRHLDLAVGTGLPFPRATVERAVEQLQGKISWCQSQEYQAFLQKLERKVAVLESEIDETRGRRFASADDQFLYGAMCKLLRSLETFSRKTVPAVERQLSWARHVEELTVMRFADRWARAREAIRKADGVTASELYAEAAIDLQPQTGLVPIGMNPTTKLWEFYHLRSALPAKSETDPATLKIPDLDSRGRLQPRPAGIVFILVPGGRFLMGCQSRDADAPNYHPSPHPLEAPVHEVHLAPYFLSRYEMTQGQWASLTDGEYPSLHAIGKKLVGNPEPTGPAHPVEHVSWQTSRALLGHFGLVLPTEAQWEYACRAGTAGPWSCGATAADLLGHANVLDEGSQRKPPRLPGISAPFHDGYKATAPVGSYEANPFGFYDMHGNVAELCRDLKCWYVAEVRPGDGLRSLLPATDGRVGRGGSFGSSPDETRTAYRGSVPEDAGENCLGVRPARELRR